MIKPVRDEQSYQEALTRTELIWGAEIGTPEGDELDVLLTLIEAYEARHYPMPPSDPVEAIKFRMDQMNLTPRDLQQYIGPKSRVSDVLNRKRELSLRQIIKLHKGMSIPYESLINEKSLS
ncbi:MAG: transcriptional regulator [Proteobacteria bacterium]|nr:MAG: transcriptional regulator [Pseudomonadota bacterium]PIE40597.1 MAG: transcriptional regulator [Gammaproteobacteria bacterium]